MPWCLDNYVLNVIDKIWELGGGKAQVPERYFDENSVNTFDFHITESKKKKYMAKEQFHKSTKKMNLYSQKCDFLLKMEVAHAFRNIKKIYFPQNLDFRGRIYPIPPHLNHMGADLCRSLLIFSTKKPLTKKGIRWLKIHIANKMGKDKISFDDRVSFVDDKISTFEKWIEDPIKFDEWTQLEDCWQTLGAVYQLIEALHSPFPEDFLSNIPIHQDGTCNGLQHYAALGRDYEGAFEVNLINREKPGDIYSKVVEIVLELIRQDLTQNLLNEDLKPVAEKLLKIIQRKTIKQTVMTIVYGVTLLGARDQIKKQLKNTYNYQEHKELEIASMYVAKQTLKAVENLFSNAEKIKEFFNKCCELIGKWNQPMMWITPIGLPVVQPYFEKEILSPLDTTLFNFVLNKIDKEKLIIKRKQISAFPPNFIHSLDSAHLMMTAERMQKNNLDFATVHDSFWTHACDVDQMNRFIREEFVKLYKMDLLQQQKQIFQDRFPLVQFPEVPQQGNLDLEEILESDYFFC